MDAKLLLLFRAGPRGWSELYYWTGPGLAELDSDLDSLISRRLALLHQSCLLQAVRCERLLTDRPGVQPLLPMLVSYRDHFDEPGLADSVQMDTWSSILWYGRADSGGKTGWLHGCPRSFTQYDPAQPAYTRISPLGWNAFYYWRLNMLGQDPAYTPLGSWCIRRSSTTHPDAQRRPLVAVGDTGAAPWNYTVRPGGAGTVLTDDLVTVGFLKGCNTEGAKGDHTVRAVAGDGTLTLRARPPLAQSVEWVPGTGRLRVHIYELAPLVEVLYRRTAVRDTGRRFWRYSWAPFRSGQNLAVHPCGVAMDYLRSGYYVKMRTWQNPSPPPEDVVWFRLADDAPLWRTETPFRSRNWSAWPTNPGLGEVIPYDPVCQVQRGPWYNGDEPYPYTALQSCGAPLVWVNGGMPGDPPVITGDRGSAPCCIPGHMVGSGGQAQGHQNALGVSIDLITTIPDFSPGEIDAPTPPGPSGALVTLWIYQQGDAPDPDTSPGPEYTRLAYYAVPSPEPRAYVALWQGVSRSLTTTIGNITPLGSSSWQAVGFMDYLQRPVTFAPIQTGFGNQRVLIGQDWTGCRQWMFFEGLSSASSEASQLPVTFVVTDTSPPDVPGTAVIASLYTFGLIDGHPAILGNIDGGFAYGWWGQGCWIDPWVGRMTPHVAGYSFLEVGCIPWGPPEPPDGALMTATGGELEGGSAVITAGRGAHASMIGSGGQEQGGAAVISTSPTGVTMTGSGGQAEGGAALIATGPFDFLLQEDTSLLLQEDGSRIIIT